eukprot:jgi/Bigna1/79951/fgenesh1_pg.66_\
MSAVAKEDSMTEAVIQMLGKRRRSHADVYRSFPSFAPILKILREYVPSILALHSINPISVPSPSEEVIDSKGNRAATMDSKDRILIHQWVLDSVGHNRVRRIDLKTRANRLVCHHVEAYYDIFVGYHRDFKMPIGQQTFHSPFFKYVFGRTNDEIAAISEEGLFVSQYYPHDDDKQDGYGPFKCLYQPDGRQIIQACYHPLTREYYVYEEGDVLVALKISENKLLESREISHFGREFMRLVPDPAAPRLFATDDTTGIVEILVDEINEGRVNVLADISQLLPFKLDAWHLTAFDKARDQLVLLGVVKGEKSVDVSNLKSYAARFAL